MSTNGQVPKVHHFLFQMCFNELYGIEMIYIIKTNVLEKELPYLMFKYMQYYFFVLGYLLHYHLCATAEGT